MEVYDALKNYGIDFEDFSGKIIEAMLVASLLRFGSGLRYVERLQR